MFRVGIRVDVLIIVSDMAVDLLMDTLTGIIIGDMGVDVLVDVNVNLFAGLMTALEFVMPEPLE